MWSCPLQGIKPLNLALFEPQPSSWIPIAHSPLSPTFSSKHFRGIFHARHGILSALLLLSCRDSTLPSGLLRLLPPSWIPSPRFAWSGRCTWTRMPRLLISQSFPSSSTRPGPPSSTSAVPPERPSSTSRELSSSDTPLLRASLCRIATSSRLSTHSTGATSRLALCVFFFCPTREC